MDIRYDCRYFKGTMPCIPHKDHGVECNSNCEYLDSIDQNILIIKLGAMGDIIRTTPIITRLKNEYPNGKIFWLTYFPEVLPESVDQPMGFRNEDLVWLRSLDFIMAINLDKEPEACALMNQLNIQNKYGFGLTKGMPAPLNENANHKFLTGISDSYSKSNTKHYLEEIFELCCWEYKDEEYLLPKYEPNEFNIDLKNVDGKVIGLNTGCGGRWTSRKWPNNSWLTLINLLQKEGYTVLLLGGENEDEQNKKLSGESGAEYMGFFSFKQFISLVAKCNAVVSTVTMAMHVAIGLRKPIVLLNNIFNPNEFHFFSPFKIVEPDKNCDCYYLPECINGRSCIEEISAEKVLAEIKMILPL